MTHLRAATPKVFTLHGGQAERAARQARMIATRALNLRYLLFDFGNRIWTEVNEGNKVSEGGAPATPLMLNESSLPSLASVRLFPDSRYSRNSRVEPVRGEHAGNNALMQIVKAVDGNYQGLDYFSLP